MNFRAMLYSPVVAVLLLVGGLYCLQIGDSRATLYKWSQTSASNATADATINWAEGMAPSAVNDSARAMMAAVAKYRDDTSGKLVTGGTSTAYTLTSNQVFASLSAMDGAGISFRVNATSGAAPTLNVDGLGAKALNGVTGTAIPTGALVSGAVYRANYVNASNEWIVEGNPGALMAPSGTVLVASQTTCPTGWTKGSTHNDKALRLVTGTPSTGGSTAFTSVFASRTIAQANLPSYNLGFSLTAAAQSITTRVRGPLGDPSGGSSFYAVAQGTDTASSTTVDTAQASSVSGTVSSNGSGTAMDFAVAYVDVVLCTKD